MRNLTRTGMQRVDRDSWGALAFFAAFAAIVGGWLFLPLGEWLSIERVRQGCEALSQVVDAHPLLCAAAFFLLCVAAAAACFPAAPVLGLSGGALFGLWPGLGIVLAAMLVGSTIAFFEARYSLRGWVKRRFERPIDSIDRGMQAHGGLYLLTLRLNPVIPYWLVNLAMGVTAIRPGTYVKLTAIGLVPATFLYVSAGTQLASIESAGDIVSAGLIATLLLLSLFPLVVRAAAASMAPRRS